MISTCTRCGKQLEIINEGDGVHTCSPKQFVYESNNGTKEVFKIGDPLAVPTSGIGLPKEEFDQACVDNVISGMAPAMQELVRQAMEREYVRDHVGPDEFELMGRNAYFDGRFTADELESMAWCMKNDKWPRRA